MCSYVTRGEPRFKFSYLPYIFENSHEFKVCGKYQSGIAKRVTSSDKGKGVQ